MADHEIDENATYQFDKQTGGFLRTTSKQGSLGFKGFYKGRPELIGSNPYSYDWLTLNRPELREGTGKLRSYRSGRGFQEEKEQRDYSEYPEQDSHDISGWASDPRPYRPGAHPAPYARPGTQMDDVVFEAVQDPSRSHRLRNVRIGDYAVPGADLETRSAWPSQSFAGGGWERVAGEVGTGQPGLNAGPRGVGTQGALPRGTQFNAVGGPPRPFGELPPAGGSSYTYTTGRKGQMGWDFGI